MENAKLSLIRDYLTKIKSANKELTKKEAFKDLLNRLYASDQTILELIDKITLGAEKTIVNIPRKDKLHKGSADTLYNHIIIEFENDLKKTLNHAKEQLAGYLLGQLRAGEGYNFTLIASDFINWKVFAPDVNCLEKIESLKEHELILNEVRSASFALNERNAEEFYYWIDRFLFKEEKQKATLKRIEEAFGYQSNIFIESFRELYKWFNEAKKFGEVQVSYEQWSKFLSIAYGSFEARDNIFLIHTYLSIFSKMLAYSVLSNDDYIDDNEMRAILDGTIFHRYNIRNFVDNDFFHWVNTERSYNNLKKVFRLIAQEISNFDFTDVDEDILKGVYQELIDIDTRHALGEYYTPDWLCERIVNEFSFTKKDKILDPACGSGSFLRAAIHRIKNLNPDITIEEINERIYGIDIHPLSVQIAKTTLLLALGKDIKNARKPIYLNVILANTLLAPEGVENLFGNEFLLNIDKDKYLLTTQILEDVKMFDEALAICDDLAEQTMGKKNESEEVFEKIFRRHFVERMGNKSGANKQIIQSFYKIYTGLKSVKEKGRDSIWRFIVQNLYKPYFLAGKFDYVIGNPPWFTYSSIRNEEYQNILNSLAEKLLVKPKKVANFPHLEIAAIFFAYCSSYFLNNEGKIAFVLPRSFFSADHHENIRSGKAAGFKIYSVWDLKDVCPLFRIPSCVFFAEKKNKREKVTVVNGKIIEGNLPDNNSNLLTARDYIKETIVKWRYVKQGKASAFSTRKSKSNDKENPYKKLFKQGATIVPRCFYFVDLDQETPDDFRDRILNIKTSEAIKNDAKKPWKGLEFKGKIESRFLFRTALAKSILPFALYNPDLIVLPAIITINEKNEKEIKLLSSDELRQEGYLNASKWFRNTENIWDIYKTEKSKNMTSNNRLNFQRGLTEQNLNAQYLVLYNSSAKDANATIVDREKLDLTFVVESKGYWLSTENKNEAYYLTAILNSKIPNDLMKDFQTRGLFGVRDVHKKILDIYFPRFYENEETHMRLAQLSEIAHKKAENYLLENPPQNQLTATRLGRLRLEIKKHLSSEMKEIDKLVKKIVG
ncbi:Endonuclease, putative [Melioribacter roseus P3M-2]|uniref:site-specific DNA-methyltransferase (adenine-specific) n=1 Tax=Melioribacter roseus (strain DSM 23840 / JCM 17771 / VKM B-2668 / P3M-2) TaxID=1191523 RepID=I6ZZ49_MELRP|nr:N-6 DNA methylase [Melioribacter roseus]AFN74288.1 Endonuclease, putative [Melioribacter roseus P3M-2]